MFKAINGALSLALLIIVLRMALPEVASLLVEIVTKVLTMTNNALDLAASQTPL